MYSSIIVFHPNIKIFIETECEITCKSGKATKCDLLPLFLNGVIFQTRNLIELRNQEANKTMF